MEKKRKGPPKSMWMRVTKEGKIGRGIAKAACARLLN